METKVAKEECGKEKIVIEEKIVEKTVEVMEVDEYGPSVPVELTMEVEKVVENLLPTEPPAEQKEEPVKTKTTSVEEINLPYKNNNEWEFTVKPVSFYNYNIRKNNFSCLQLRKKLMRRLRKRRKSPRRRRKKNEKADPAHQIVVAAESAQRARKRNDAEVFRGVENDDQDRGVERFEDDREVETRDGREAEATTETDREGDHGVEDGDHEAGSHSYFRLIHFDLQKSRQRRMSNRQGEVTRDCQETTCCRYLRYR